MLTRHILSDQYVNNHVLEKLFHVHALHKRAKITNAEIKFYFIDVITTAEMYFMHNPCGIVFYKYYKPGAMHF